VQDQSDEFVAGRGNLLQSDFEKSSEERKPRSFDRSSSAETSKEIRPEIDPKTGRVKVHANGYKLLDDGQGDSSESRDEIRPEINPKTGRVKVHENGYKLLNEAGSSDKRRGFRLGEVTQHTSGQPISCSDRADREDILLEYLKKGIPTHYGHKCRKRVIIVGAGISGLTAAKLLQVK
jgi:hypothetical protein